MGASRDLSSNVLAVQSIAPAAQVSADVTGTGVDTKGYGSVTVCVNMGTVTGTWTPQVEESDDDSTYTAVAAADLIGAFAAVTTANDNATQQVGYRGSARYVRVFLDETATGTAFASADVVLGHPSFAPAA